MLERLVHSLETCPIVKRGDYDYFIHPITDGVPKVEPALIRDVCTGMVKVLDLQGVQMFVVAEAMGIHIGTTLSLMTDIPFTIVRKRKYELPGEIALHQTTGYSKGELYMNGVHRGDRVAVVDDVLSTGGTMKALIRGLDQVGADIADICVAIRRGKQDVGRPVKALVDIEVVGGKVRIVGRSL